MYTLMVVSLFLGYVLILIFGLLHVAQGLLTRTSPLLVSYSDLEADRDDELLGATQPPPNKSRTGRSMKGLTREGRDVDKRLRRVFDR